MAGTVRRLQATGGGSYVITLPKEWVRRFGLEAGGEVVVEYSADGTLRIRPLSSGSRHGLRQVRVEAGQASAEELLRWIVSYYIAGVDVIEVTVGGRGHLVRDLVSLVASRLMGVEVVEESSERLVLQVVVDPESMPLDSSFSRLARTVGYMLDDLAAGVEARDRDLLEAIPERDDVVDKLFIFVWRQVFLVLSGRKLVHELRARSLPDAVLIMTAAKNIERIGDHVSNVAASVSRLKGDCLGELKPLLVDVDNVYREAIAVFTRPARQKAEESMRLCLETRSRLSERLPSTCGGIAPPGLAHSLRRIADYSMDIVELAMNRYAVWGLEDQGGR